MDRGQCHAALCVAMRIAFARVRWRYGIGSLEGHLRVPLILVGREGCGFFLLNPRAVFTQATSSHAEALARPRVAMPPAECFNTLNCTHGNREVVRPLAF